MRVSRVAIIALAGIISVSSWAQDLEPRALARAPVGMHFVVLAYGHSSGNVVIDQALPIENFNANVHSLSLAFATTFGLFNRMAKLDVIIPFSNASWEGLLDRERVFTERTGLGDPMARLSVNILGAPALAGQDFFASRSKFQLAGSLKIRAPLGQYDPTKLVNLGTNRWLVRPSIGGSVQLGKWVLESHLNLWLLTRNNSFYNGNTLSQKPILILQIHVIHEFKPGLWAAISVGRSQGGETIVNDLDQDNLQKNSRFGAALAIPLSASHSLKLLFTSGVTTRYGADFDTYGLAYQYRWGGLR
ncbi:MAG: transporter [Deltaproteobacteria bacterium]